MIKPPVVYVAGLLRALGRPIDTADWAWILPLAGQMPFYPPNVSGWDDTRWLDTSTWRGHWWAANYALEHGTLDTDPAKTRYPASETPEQALDAALAFWGRPGIGGVTRDRLVAFGRQCAGVADEDWKRQTYPILRQNALRILVATSPDLMTS
jgi:hypothetical protein